MEPYLVSMLNMESNPSLSLYKNLIYRNIFYLLPSGPFLFGQNKSNSSNFPFKVRLSKVFVFVRE